MKIKMTTMLKILAVIIILLGFPTLLRATTPKGSITIDRISEIKYPTDQAWSSDGKTIAFLWDWAGKQDIYTVEAGSPPVALTDFPVSPDTLRSDITHFEWISANQVLFVKEGTIYTVSTTTRTPRRMPGFEGVAVFAMLHDMKQILYVQKGQIWINTLDGKNGRQLTHLSGDQRAGTISVSQDDLHIAYSVSTPTEDTYAVLPFNGDRVRVVGRAAGGGGYTALMSIYGGEDITLPGGGGGFGGGGGGRGAGGIQWVTGPDGPGVLQQETSADRKTREIKVTWLTGVTHTLWKDYDPAWWSPSNVPRTVVSPDGKWVAFICDRTGWPLVYAIPTDATSEKQAKQLSIGEKVDGYISWSPDSKRVAYAGSNDGDAMSRYIYVADPASGKIETVVKDPGVSIEPVFSPDGSMIAFSRSSVEHPLEVFEAPAHADAKIVRLTSSMPPEIQVADLTPPKPLYYPSRGDKKPVPATLWVNKNIDLTKKHPAIIWVHGSGDGQNYLGWQPGSWRMYYAMDQYFAQQGYIILTVDYRGNSGYSRDWATGSYGDPGGSETGDVNAGADYLKTLPYVDGDRIGVWGLSYGGYMVLQSLVVDPTLFNCGIDVAGVGDWYTYNVGFSYRLAGNPSSDPEVWDRSAPVRHLDKLARPLLILQGTADTNVPFWETLKVVDTLEKLHKPFDLMIYPGEPHWFRRSYVLQDAWHRAEDFYDMHLKPTETPPIVASN
jgi:Tol biopolymer transport system component/dienelactone hydrolase